MRYVFLKKNVYFVFFKAGKGLSLDVELATHGLYSRHSLAAEVIPYQEQWKRVTTIES